MLFIFGGISEFEEEPKEFSKEFKMAIAGLVVSLALDYYFVMVGYNINDTFIF